MEIGHNKGLTVVWEKKRDKKKSKWYSNLRNGFFLIRNGILGNLVNKKSTKTKQLLVSNTNRSFISIIVKSHYYYTYKTSIARVNHYSLKILVHF